MKHCKMCRYQNLCGDVPGWCVLLQYAAIVGVIATVSWLLLSATILR